MYYSERILELPLKFIKSGTIHNKTVLIYLYCKSNTLIDGKVVDIDEIENIRKELLGDYVSRVIKNSPTLEHLAEYIYKQISNCYKVEVADDLEKIIYENKE